MNNLINTLADRVGFKQERKNKRYAPLSPDLVVSNEGLYYNELAPKYISLKGMSESFDLYEGELLDDYDVATTYSIGDQVKTVVDGVYKAYISLIDNNLGNDTNDTTSWESILSYELRDLRNVAIKEVVREVDDKFQLTTNQKTLLEYTPLFNRAIQRPKIQQKSDKKRGMEFSLSKNLGMKVKVDKIMFWYDVAETLTFEIYHTSQADAIDTFDIDVIKTNGAVSYEINKTLDYFNGDVKGAYYIMIDETSLNGNFYGYDFNGGEPCQKCPKGEQDRLYWGKYTRYMWVRPMSFQGEFSEQSEYICTSTSDTRSIFNFVVSAECDFEDVYIRNVQMFDRLVQHKVSIKILTYMLESERINYVDTHMKKNIEKVLKGYTEKEFTQGRESGKEVEIFSDGIIPKYNKLIEKLRLNIEGICSECSPYNNPLKTVY